MIYLRHAIQRCRSCGEKKLEDIISLGNLYLSEFTSDVRKVPKYPLALVFCQSCTLLQLKYTTPPSLLYTENYGYKSGINYTMKQELQKIVQKAEDLIGKRNSKIVALDIGANDGTLLSNYSKKILRIGVEPIKKFVRECEKYSDIVINDYFHKESYIKKVKNKKADIITAISCFYDLDNPNQFVDDVRHVLSKDGIFIIQQNYLVKMLEENAFDNIVHEHLEYYSLLSIENLLNRHGMEVFDVELSEINGGSFRTYIGHANTRKVSSAVEKLRGYEKKLQLGNKKNYEKFAKQITQNCKKLNKFIKNRVRDGKTIYVYGASTRGNTLLQYAKLNNKLITAASERNPEKWGKKIASVGIPIISEDRARKEKPDYMLVLPWFFKKEFVKREKKYLRSGGHFIFPLPRLEVI